MDPGGTRLSEFLAESKRRAGDPPNLRHGSEDLKVFNKQDAKETYAKTPSLSGARLMIASCDTKNGNQLSSGDFDVAYLQSNNFTSGQLVARRSSLWNAVRSIRMEGYVI